MAPPKAPKQSPSPESHVSDCDTLVGSGDEPQAELPQPSEPSNQIVSASDQDASVYSDSPSDSRGTGAGRTVELPYRLRVPPLTPKSKRHRRGDSAASSPYTPTPKPRHTLPPSPRYLDLNPHVASSSWIPQTRRLAAEMSKSKDGQGETYHQEYIASSRYRNDLPPPEMPPKLLEIPHEGSGRLLTPGYTSNMARREEPNIDVDAEGGMPIDLVGMPGLHLGDESAIMAPENPPPLDPADLPLLMTLEQLKNPAPKDSNVSFLRRTQYISTGTRAPSNPNAAPSKARPRPQQKPKISQDDPTYIKKYLQKGFDIANPNSKHTGEDTASRIKGNTATKAEHDAWANPVHPDNPKLKPAGFYPVLPDLQGFADPGGYVQFKFDKPPVQADGGKRDKRMDVSVLLPSAPDEKICQDHATKTSLHKTNPELYPDPGPVPWDYDLFVPEKKDSTEEVIASLDQQNPNRDDQGLYTHESPDGAKFHRYDRVRTYATSSQTLSTDDKQRDLALALYDPADVKDGEGVKPRQRAAYYYPILGKTRLTQDRARNIAKAGLGTGHAKAKEDQVHQIQMGVRDPDEAETYKRALHRAAIDPKFANTMPPPPEAPEEAEEAEAENQEKTEEAEGKVEGEIEGEGAGDEPSSDHQAAANAEQGEKSDE